MHPFTLLPAALILGSLPALGRAQDWPQYHGPRGDRTAPGAASAWEAAGPRVAWKCATPLGFSSFAVAGGQAVTLIVREVDGEQREVCVALDARTGAERWASALGKAEYDGGGDAGAQDNEGGDGPRGTPSLVNERVYVYDAHFVLWCLAARDGATLWRRDVRAEHGGGGLDWQNASAPLVDGERVFVAGGGAGSALLAFDAEDGTLAWKTGEEKPTHATPIAAELGGVRQVIFFVQSGLVACDPNSGAILWRAEHPFRVSTAASPVVAGDLVYCSAGYGVGAGLYRVTRDAEGFHATRLWYKRNELMNHWSTPVVKDGHLYGMFSFKKYGDGPLACVDLATGEERWAKDGFGPGNCILIGDTLAALSDAGELVLVAASPEAYRELARADVLEGKCWSSPAFADGALFVRSTREGARVDVSR